MKRRRRKTDRKEMAQFVWTLLVGLAAAIAALHEAGTLRDTSERGPANSVVQRGYSPVDLLDSRRASK